MRFLIILFLVSCTNQAPKPESATIPPITPVAEIGKTIGFQCDADCTTKEKAKLAKAEILANEMVRSKCFADFMMQRKFDPAYSEGKTNEQILKAIKSTALTVPVHYYYKWGSTVGYRQPPKPDIYFNRRFHDSYNECNTVSNAVHEWSHSLGFGHDFNATARRPYSVPYSINAAADKCCFKDQVIK